MAEGLVLEGERELSRTLGHAADELVGEDVNRKVADRLLERADPHTPREGGALAASGSTSADAEGGTVTYDEVYAGVIHNGWPDHNIDAQPWLADTVRDQQSDLVDVYVDHTEDLLRQVHGT